jgi:hypothetical protein
MDDSAANSAAIPSPTGVATKKPVFEPLTSTPGVARAWRKRKPAAAMNAAATSTRRASE